MFRIPITRPTALAAATLLAGCATAPPPDTTPGSAAAPLAAQWHTPLPHSGRLADLSRWWQQFNDPLLLQLIEASQQASPSLASAGARIVEARAAHTAGTAAGLPTLGATASAERGRAAPGAPTGSTASLGLQASWELDLFGALAAGARAADARLASRQAEWHGARVAVAAEVASLYVSLRACEAQRAQAERDQLSREDSARLTRLAAEAGFQPPAAADLAMAGAAQGSAALVQQRTQCDTSIKALVALSALDETTLRQRLAAATAQLPRPAGLVVQAVPAQVLAQRPDIAAAAQELIAASADAKQAQAQRWPRITLAGSIGAARSSGGGVSTDGSVWQVGPVAVSLPIFDGGVRRAQAEAARARYQAAGVAYAARLREAVHEVESALLALHSATVRDDDTRRAAEGYERAFIATEASQRGGLSSLFELEDARRSLLAARSARIEQQRESVIAWIAIYRALGGGWSLPTAAAPTTQAAATAPNPTPATP